MYYNTKQAQELKPRLVASYDIRPGNGQGLILFRHLINLLLTYLDTYPLTYSPGIHTKRKDSAPVQDKTKAATT